MALCDFLVFAYITFFREAGKAERKGGKAKAVRSSKCGVRKSALKGAPVLMSIASKGVLPFFTFHF